MIKKLRIAILLYVLVFVGLGQLLDSRRATDWDNQLWVDVYLSNANGSERVQSYLDTLGDETFAGVERFFSDEASRFSLGIEQPFRVRLAGQIDDPLPALPEHGKLIQTILWSLETRWYVWRLHGKSDRPRPDITVFAIYHEAQDGISIDRSTALQKGLIAIANLYATRGAIGTNQMIIAHELLHTLGASDKYSLATGLPLHPDGFAEPTREPLYPQTQAELMAGRIPLKETEAHIPPSLNRVVIGPLTAAEIGWTR